MIFRCNKRDDKGWPFKLMAVGDECLVTGACVVKIQLEAHKYAHKVGKKVSCKKVGESVSVKRIA